MFNEYKTTQAAAGLLKRADGTMNYMVLIKMLYLADRASLLKRGRPITGDSFKSMKYGPVLSKVHDLITEQPGPDDAEIWKKFISDPCDWSVKLVSDPGSGALSENEMQILDSTFEEYKAFLNLPFKLADKLHEDLPEVVEIEKGKQQPLPIKDILEANQVSDNERDAIIAEIESLNEMSELLAS